MRFRMRTLLLLPVVCAGGLFCCRIPLSHWSGVKGVDLAILIVGSDDGLPIEGAEVELLHPFDPERPTVKGRTARDGRVVLRNRFNASGYNYVVGGSERVSFVPWSIRVDARGFSKFRAALKSSVVGPDEEATDPPLNLSYPISGPVTVPLKRSTEGL